VPVTSQPPPSEEIPGKSGGGLYLAGAVVLIAATVGLISWKSCGNKATQQATVVTATVSAPTVEAPVALYAPPPPPKMDEEDAGVDAGKATAKSSGSGPAVPGGSGPCGSNCSGTATSALSSALRGTANLARGCYNRALRNNSEVSGSLMVSVQIGPSGQVCSASIGSDTVHSSEVSSCVLARYRGQTFPAPAGGCVTANIPISFTTKQ
jgi:hypothetical protein